MYLPVIGTPYERAIHVQIYGKLTLIVGHEHQEPEDNKTDAIDAIVNLEEQAIGGKGAR